MCTVYCDILKKYNFSFLFWDCLLVLKFSHRLQNPYSGDLNPVNTYKKPSRTTKNQPESCVQYDQKNLRGFSCGHKRCGHRKNRPMREGKFVRRVSVGLFRIRKINSQKFTLKNLFFKRFEHLTRIQKAWEQMYISWDRLQNFLETGNAHATSTD